MNSPHKYPGKELEIFSEAKNWKAYLASQILEYIRYPVLEVGAGIGANTNFLNQPEKGPWHLIEPDPDLIAELRLRQSSQELPPNCRLQQGTIDDLDLGSRFGTILYIDVLEHIKDDSAEVQKAIQHLESGGYLIILCPAFPFLYGSFDAAIGHYRRYTRKGLRALLPPNGGHLLVERYIDTMGFFANMANRFLLKQEYPTSRQVQFWDRRLVPFSRKIDNLSRSIFGKSVLIIWQAD